MTPFDKALNQLPDVCGYDPFAHHTVEDLCWLCLHELDLHAEQEYWHTAADRKKLLAFCKKHNHYAAEAQTMYTKGIGLQKADAYI